MWETNCSTELMHCIVFLALMHMFVFAEDAGAEQLSSCNDNFAPVYDIIDPLSTTSL